MRSLRAFPKEVSRKYKLLAAYRSLVNVGRIPIYAGYTLRVVAVESGTKKDTVEQEFFFEVEWQVDDVEKARKSWDSWSVIS